MEINSADARSSVLSVASNPSSMNRRMGERGNQNSGGLHIAGQVAFEADLVLVYVLEQSRVIHSAHGMADTFRPQTVYCLPDALSPAASPA
jgi:hypothetical protein